MMTVTKTSFKMVTVAAFVTLNLFVPTVASAQNHVAPQPLGFSAPGSFNVSRDAISNPSFVSVKFEYEKGLRQYEKGNYHLAKVAFQNVVDARQAETYSQSISYLGLIAMKRGDHERAAGLFNHALRGNPNIYGLKAVLGLSYLEMGDVDKAEAILADMKRKQHRHYEFGSNEAERHSAIQMLENALLRTA